MNAALLLMPVIAASIALAAHAAIAQPAEPLAAPAVKPRLDDCPWPQRADVLSPAWDKPLFIAMSISASGQVLSPRLEASSGDAAFNERLLDAVRQCRATPAVRDGVAVDSDFRLRFVLRDPSPQAQGSPRMVFQGCTPDYPAESLRLEEQGTTTLRFVIDETGGVVEAVMVASSGSPRLDEAALLSLRRCMFRPARGPDGAPIKAETRVEYIWRLQ
jgi:TonB family protein